jgi:DNA-binding HxlR family transcriptional regulator
MYFKMKSTPEIEAKLEILTEMHQNKWRPAIINLLLEHESMRFGEIKRELDITPKVLTDHLKWLEQHQFINREAFAEVPPHVEYSLTEIGQQLGPVHEKMRMWAEFYINHVDSES